MIFLELWQVNYWEVWWKLKIILKNENLNQHWRESNRCPLRIRRWIKKFAPCRDRTQNNFMSSWTSTTAPWPPMEAGKSIWCNSEFCYHPPKFLESRSHSLFSLRVSVLKIDFLEWALFSRESLYFEERETLSSLIWKRVSSLKFIFSLFKILRFQFHKMGSNSAHKRKIELKYNDWILVSLQTS